MFLVGGGTRRSGIVNTWIAGRSPIIEVHFGGGSLQVARRLRAMLEHLLRVLPEGRHAALTQELTLLQRSAQRFFSDDEDRASAAIGDLQGIGSSRSQ